MSFSAVKCHQMIRSALRNYYQNAILELKTDSIAKHLSDGKSLTEFWSTMITSYLKVTRDQNRLTLNI